MAPENYEARKGSTIVTLKKDYLATLPAGTHELTLDFAYGECTAGFTTVAAKPAEKSAEEPAAKPAEKPTEKPADAPKTGDSGMAIWAVLGTLAAFGGAEIVLRKKNGRR